MLRRCDSAVPELVRLVSGLYTAARARVCSSLSSTVQALQCLLRVGWCNVFLLIWGQPALRTAAQWLIFTSVLV